MNRLVIIDGNAILHRAYHAIPLLSTPDGTPTNAVYGFTTMLLKLYTDLRPTHLVVAFDRPAPTFRKKLYTEYQATRPKMDDELSVQVAVTHDVVTALGIPIYEKDGYEADDLIGTIVSQMTGSTKFQNGHVIIVTGDRDILQLVRKDLVYVYMPVKGLSESQLFDEEKTREKLGVAPDQVVTLKALMGDSSDNYPGVTGIGPKTARALVSMFGSLENIYEAVKKNDERISPSVREKLRNGREDAFLSSTLAQIKQDVPIDVDFSGMHIDSLDTPQAREALMKLSFVSLADRLAGKVNKKQKNKQENKKRASVASAQQELF